MEKLTTIYPLRPSEQVEQSEYNDVDIEKLALTEADWANIAQLEEPLITELVRVDDDNLEIYKHQFYPQFFEGEVGRLRYHFLYEDRSLENLVLTECAKYGLDTKKEEQMKKLYSVALTDAMTWPWPINDGQEYQLPNLGAALVELIKGDDVATISTPTLTVHLTEDATSSADFDDDRLIDSFSEIDLDGYNTSYLSAIEAKEKEQIQEQFVTEYREAGGSAEHTINPARVTRVVNLTDLVDKLSTLRALKQKVRQSQREIEGSNPLSEAEQIVLELYRRRINVMLANQYANVKFLENDQSGNTAVDQAKGLVALPAVDSTTQNLSRINRFLRGVGVSDEGVYQEIPQRMADYVRRPAQTAEKTPESEKYNAIKVDAVKMSQLLSALIKHYGADASWELSVDPRRKNLAVDTDKKVVKVPETYSNGLIGALAVAEHEGTHVLQRINQDNASADLIQLIKRQPSGRNAVMAEGGAMQTEKRSQQELVGVEKAAKPYFYIGLDVKERGGTFRDCFDAMLRAYAQLDLGGIDLESLLKDQKKYQKAANYCYERSMRLFRDESSLNDATAGITDTTQLSYVEQEMIADVLEENGLSKLVFLRGVDLYSLKDLQRLGVVDLAKVVEPDLYLVHNFWPVLKTQLDQGADFEKAWAEALKAIS